MVNSASTRAAARRPSSRSRTSVTDDRRRGRAARASCATRGRGLVEHAVHAGRTVGVRRDLRHEDQLGIARASPSGRARHGMERALDSVNRRARRFHRARSHGSADDAPPRRGRPRRSPSRRAAAARSTPRSRSARVEGDGPAARRRRVARSRSCACPTRPQVVEVARRRARRARPGPHRRRHLDDRPRGRARAARTGHRDRRAVPRGAALGRDRRRAGRHAHAHGRRRGGHARGRPPRARPVRRARSCTSAARAWARS